MQTYLKPVQIVPLSSDALLRIGGLSPDLGEAIEPHLGYFFTAPHPTLADHGVSVFISRSFDHQWDNRGSLVTRPPILRIVAHSFMGARTDDMNASVLTGHSLALGTPEPDYADCEQVWCHHKVGGISALEVAEVLPDETVSKIRTAAWQFWCQIAFPDANDDNIDGDWPVCDCLFALYYQPRDDSFAAVWERI